MSPLTLHVLRRLATYALVLAVLLGGVLPALRYFGLVGPSVEQQIEASQRALDAARTYGADERVAEFRAAQAELERARKAAGQGQRVAARRAADAARERAIDAQRVALAERADLRSRATAAVDEVDHELNALETLFDETTRGLPKAEVAPLLSLMKSARQTGARLYVAFEQGDFRTVVAGRDATLAALADARRTLEARR